MSEDIEKKGRAIPRLLDDFVINYGGGCCLYNSDCLDILRTLPDGSVDMILQDPPYNMTACKWECELDFPALWTEWERVIKDNGAIVMTASQPFTALLMVSNLKLFKHEWIWLKGRPSNFMNAKIAPLKYHENIIVFSKTSPVYNPIKWHGNRNHGSRETLANHNTLGIQQSKTPVNTDDEHYPQSYINIKSGDPNDSVHPSQKPVDLFRYLIRTYTNEGETVFDGYGGSGTTAVACIKENRKYIVCEKEAEYIEISKKRIDEATRQGNLFSAVGCCPHDL